MSDPFLGEIRMTAFNFAPYGWAKCDGSIMNIAQNSALFALLGTTFGGNGQTTFGLPNLCGRVPVHPKLGQQQGVMGGAETVTLTQANMPAHSHGALGAAAGSDTAPSANVLLGNVFEARGAPRVYQTYNTAIANLVALNPSSLGPVGAGTVAAHNNMQPSLTVNFIIATMGMFPSRP